MTSTARLLPALLCLALAACAAGGAHTAAAPPEGSTLRVGIIETTDLHTNVMSYDYYKLTEDKTLGFGRAATLIRAARKEFDNSLTFDSGDTVQGTILADYQALVKQVPCSDELAIYKAMDSIGYDAGTIGNHEFNYGLDFLGQVTGTAFSIDGVKRQQCHGPRFPLVLSNVVDAKSGKPIFTPWRILERKVHVQAPDGATRDVTLRVGVIGFTPTGIMDWDRRNLEGKVNVIGMVEAAQHYVPAMRKAGADLVVALVHGGLDTSPYTARTENAGWHLAGVPGIDVLLLGHSHQIFPNPGDARSRYAHMAEVDNQRGFVRGIPAVMGNYYGKNIGLVDLALAYRNGRWQVDGEKTHAEVRSVKNANGNFVDADAGIAPLVAQEHAGAMAYVKTPIGRSDYAITSYFAGAGDTSALLLINRADRDYVERYIRDNHLGDLAGLPVLGAASPFKAGFGGPNDFTDVAAGPMTIASAADLYLYPNTLTAVKVDGAGVKAWLEKSAEWFNRIDPAKKESQELLNRRFPTYDFDVLQGDLTYAIDVTQPTGSRIVDLRYKGQPIAPGQAFLVVTNNYRASGGGRFPGLDGKSIVIGSPDANREVLINFVRAQGEITRAKFGNERNWRFVPVKTAGPVVITAAAGKLDIARDAGLTGVSELKDNGDGSATYAVDLGR